MDLSIVIVSYNTKNFIKDCILSIYKNTQGIKYEIIVVDNASSDGSAGIIKKEFPDVILIAGKKNLGFSSANNKGVRKSHGRYVLFLNPDTLIYKDSISQMLKFMDSHGEIGAATCKLLLPNGRIDDASHRGFPTPWNSFTYFLGLSKTFPSFKLFSGYNLSFLDLDRTHEIDACAGAFMIVRRKAGDDIGWWDEDYFFYGEDLEFCFRLKEKGWKIYYHPDVSVLHYKGVSGGIKKLSKQITTASLETKKRATDSRFDAMRIFYEKHYEKKYSKILNWLVYKAIDLKQNLALRKLK
ncbi:hypothetical protein A3F29_00250 [Candidatus Roizmanbacteria bacterium RIFCSPHIGHO2_12_FULL_33_9]|uniref:Glycosyltransferase 2-like domain-containing protein n=1 Tax=Candidatus Roizmanbacteria bacterium RIFCSPHIGHO2_12_FULL_33_9 TaxID=1802045 RepID=A0A1F7HJ71_9BACT|nr:MAG: hypothetical protein A3F29_00250 [Candidatus Roizmanbacteria bacterium RIFCSPHIGHO2_12_FULL_33_9]